MSGLLGLGAQGLTMRAPLTLTLGTTAGILGDVLQLLLGAVGVVGDLDAARPLPTESLLTLLPPMAFELPVASFLEDELEEASECLDDELESPSLSVSRPRMSLIQNEVKGLVFPPDVGLLGGGRRARASRRIGSEKEAAWWCRRLWG